MTPQLQGRTAVPSLAPGRWEVDPARSECVFTIGHVGHRVSGAMPVHSGHLLVSSEGLPTEVVGVVTASAVDTGNPRRDKDLRKPRFLDLDRYPSMVFTAGQATAAQPGWSVAGTVEGRGERARIVFDVRPEDSEDGVTVTARATLDRRDLGLRFPRMIIGREVRITLRVHLIRPGNDGHHATVQ